MRTEDQYTGAPSSSSLGESYGFEAVAHTVPAPVGTLDYVVLKRTLDILICIALLPVILPVCGCIALLIKLNSPGPVFFSHRRIRKSGGFFSMWKFRTICVNSAEVLEKYLAAHPETREEWNRTRRLQRDPRVDRLGNFLRHYSLDELPQIWNVLRGEMSLVGPRPIVAREVEKYGDCFACYCRVKPGVTGLWQVSGRNTLTYKERAELDCSYVRDWSLWLDTKIICKTIACIVNPDGTF